MANRCPNIMISPEKAYERVSKIIQTLDGMRQRINTNLCRLTTQVGESNVDASGNITAAIIQRAMDLNVSIFNARAEFVKETHRNYPALDLTMLGIEAEAHESPTAGPRGTAWINKLN